MAEKRVALITGITGQDGSYLAELLQPEDLVNDMMASDIRLMTKEQYLQDGGYRTNNHYE